LGTSPDPFLAGQLDDVRMYRRALGAAEITAPTAAGATAAAVTAAERP
jgi:hypothetical protein